MKNSVEAMLIILMMNLVTETVSDFSLSCIKSLEGLCSEHKMSCTGKNVIWIKDGAFGYRNGCGLPPLLSTYKNNNWYSKKCSSPCCQYLQTDCLKDFSDSGMKEVRSKCSHKMKCNLKKILFDIPENSTKCKEEDIHSNAYTKIDYDCVNQSEYHRLESMPTTTEISAKTTPSSEPTQEWLWETTTHTSSSSSPSSLSPPSSLSTSSNHNDSATPFEVDGTITKRFRDQQAETQSPDTGGVIGASIGGLVVLIILVLLSVYLLKRRIRNTKQVSKGEKPSRVAQGVSVPITFHKNTDPTVVIHQPNGGRSNSTGYEIVDFETSDDLQADANAYHQLEEGNSSRLDIGDYEQIGADNSKLSHPRLDRSDCDHAGADNPKISHSRLDTSDYDHIGADNSKISHSRLDNNGYDHVGADNTKTSHPRLDRKDYDHLGEEHFQNSSLDMGDYDHIPDVGDYDDNYHHIGADDFKKRETNMADCDYSHIQDTLEYKNERV